MDEILEPSIEDIVEADKEDLGGEDLLSDGATKEDLDGDEPSLDDLPI